jgi:hypothetical protein
VNLRPITLKNKHPPVGLILCLPRPGLFQFSFEFAREVFVDLLSNSQISALFRTPHCGGSRHEQGALRGSLRGGGIELELALIELIDDLAHG